MLVPCGSSPSWPGAENLRLPSTPSILTVGRWSGRRAEDDAIQGRPGDSKAGSYFGNWDVSGSEQRPDGLDLFGGGIAPVPCLRGLPDAASRLRPGSEGKDLACRRPHHGSSV